MGHAFPGAIAVLNPNMKQLKKGGKIITVNDHSPISNWQTPHSLYQELSLVMFGFLFHRWRKASKCKKLLQQLQSRLKLLKNKNYAISRHLRDDIALFIRINDHTRALLRTKQLLLVQNSISIYDLLLQFSDFILLHFSSIRKHRLLLVNPMSYYLISITKTLNRLYINMQSVG